jgi:hypothetical protein
MASEQNKAKKKKPIKGQKRWNALPKTIDDVLF